MQNKSWKITSIVFIVLFILSFLLFIFSLYLNYTYCWEGDEPKKPEVFSAFDSWSRDYYSEDEMIFSYYVYNFGNEEAKDLKAKCYIKQEGTLKKSVEEKIGNLASHSWVYKEMYIEFKESSDEEYGFCFISNCSNCKLLRKEIPELSQLENSDAIF